MRCSWVPFCSLHVPHINILKSIIQITGFLVFKCILSMFIINRNLSLAFYGDQEVWWLINPKANSLLVSSIPTCLFSVGQLSKLLVHAEGRVLRESEVCQRLCHSLELQGQISFWGFIVTMALQKHFESNSLLQKLYLAFCLCCFTGTDVKC